MKLKNSLVSYNHSGISISSFSLSKLKMVSFINFNGNLVFRYFCLIPFYSLLKSDAILLARCSSPVVVLWLYLTRILKILCTGNFVDLLKTCVVISMFSLSNFVSRNFVGSISDVSFIFSL